LSGEEAPMKSSINGLVPKRSCLLCVLLIACATLALTGCTPGMKGTYSDAMGAFVLDLKTADKAAFTFAGEVADCSYSTAGNQLMLDCKGDAGKAVFTIHDDGSLTGPPGSFIPALRKRKS
jgi:hypothetical protein